MSLTPEDKVDIATIAAQAAVAAVQAMGIAPATVSTPTKKAEELPDDPEDEAAAAATIRENEEKTAAIEQMATDILPHIMEPRHLEVFKWMAQGSSNAVALRAVVRQSVSAALPNYREATRGGMSGGSTKNPATLAQLKGE